VAVSKDGLHYRFVIPGTSCFFEWSVGIASLSMIVTRRAISREPAPINVIRWSADDFDRHPVSLSRLEPNVPSH